MKALALQIIARLPNGIKEPFLRSEMAVNGSRPGDAEFSSIMAELIRTGMVMETKDEFSGDRLYTATKKGREQAAKF